MPFAFYFHWTFLPMFLLNVAYFFGDYSEKHHCNGNRHHKVRNSLFLTLRMTIIVESINPICEWGDNWLQNTKLTKTGNVYGICDCIAHNFKSDKRNPWPFPHRFNFTLEQLLTINYQPLGDIDLPQNFVLFSQKRPPGPLYTHIRKLKLFLPAPFNRYHPEYIEIGCEKLFVTSYRPPVY